jgi:hypothetical protein
MDRETRKYMTKEEFEKWWLAQRPSHPVAPATAAEVRELDNLLEESRLALEESQKECDRIHAECDERERERQLFPRL